MKIRNRKCDDQIAQLRYARVKEKCTPEEKLELSHVRICVALTFLVKCILSTRTQPVLSTIERGCRFPRDPLGLFACRKGSTRWCYCILKLLTRRRQTSAAGKSCYVTRPRQRKAVGVKSFLRSKHDARMRIPCIPHHYGRLRKTQAMHAMHVETPVRLGRNHKAHEGCARGAGCERSYARVKTLTTTGVWRRMPTGGDHTLNHRECKPYTRR